jgi:hypothetical protein
MKRRGKLRCTQTLAIGNSRRSAAGHRLFNDWKEKNQPVGHSRRSQIHNRGMHRPLGETTPRGTAGATTTRIVTARIGKLPIAATHKNKAIT